MTFLPQDFLFLAPERLILVLLPALLLGAYLVRQRRRKAYVVRFTDPDLLDAVAPKRPGRRRHAVAAVYLVAALLLVVAAARPAFATEIPNEPTVVLALDVSLSMEATDVQPSRIAAARDAAHAFVAVIPAGVRVGLVAFDGNARAVIPPTTEKTVLDRAIDRLTLGPGTAIGEAIYSSLDLLDDPSADGTPAQSSDSGSGAAAEKPGAIVLMSDGDTTMGRPNGPAAQAAAARGVPISTVAFGTDNGTVTVDGQTVQVPVNKAALKQIASTTGGKAFEAASAEEIKSVFEDLGKGVGTRTEPKEMTDQLAMLALGAAVVAAVGSLVWFSRLP